MYFPYLRGKQYELLALKELAPLLGQSGQIVPVIEPVKSPDGGLQRCLEALWSHGVSPILVLNPAVGDLSTDEGTAALIEYVNDTFAPGARWRLGVLSNEDLDIGSALRALRNIGPGFELALIHDGPAEDLDRLRTETDLIGRRFDLVSDQLRPRHFRPFFGPSTGVIMHDGFPAEQRNSAYLTREESVFNEDIVFYREEGWGGFGDYLTVGKGWSQGGFTPRAVAIHWTYQPSTSAPVMIRHFTSESNGDIANVGGKFLEAVRKLVAFLDVHDIHTAAAEVMRGHLAANTYPGLGVVKKLSIQNHLELVAGILGDS